MKREEFKMKINSVWGKPIFLHETSEIVEMVNPTMDEMLNDDILLMVSAENNKLQYENAKLNEEVEKLKERMNRNLKISDETVFKMRDNVLGTIKITADVLFENRELRDKVKELEAEIKEMKTVWE